MSDQAQHSFGIVERVTELVNMAYEYVGEKIGALIDGLLGGGGGLMGGKAAGGVALASSRGASYDAGHAPAVTPNLPPMPTKGEAIAQAQAITTSLPSQAMENIKDIQVSFASVNNNIPQSMQVMSGYDLGGLQPLNTPGKGPSLGQGAMLS